MEVLEGKERDGGSDIVDLQGLVPGVCEGVLCAVEVWVWIVKKWKSREFSVELDGRCSHHLLVHTCSLCAGKLHSYM